MNNQNLFSNDEILVCNVTIKIILKGCKNFYKIWKLNFDYYNLIFYLITSAIAATII